MTGNDCDDGRRSNNWSITRFTNPALLHANTSTAMTSLLTLSLLDGEFVTVVTASSVADRLDKSDSEIGVGGESVFSLAAKERGGGSGHTQYKECDTECLQTKANKQQTHMTDT